MQEDINKEIQSVNDDFQDKLQKIHTKIKEIIKKSLEHSKQKQIEKIRKDINNLFN